MSRPADRNTGAAAAPRVPTANQLIAQTQHWLERAVIGLNLCPFAKAVHQKQQIRWVVSPARTRQRLLQDLMHELQRLQAADAQQIETTVLIHPCVLRPFARYNEFLDVADGLLHEMRLDGVLQIASFHPQYRFADAAADDPANNSNRSPFPMLHLLREASVEQAVKAFPDAAHIYQRNIETLRDLGADGFAALMGMGSSRRAAAPAQRGGKR
jgi:uncharacterized protein